MRMVWLTILAGCLTANVSAGTIGSAVTLLGGNSYRDTFTISGFAFTTGQELDIFFDPAQYGTLSNGVAQPSSDWSLVLFQPNNPPGAPGDYSALVLVNNPSLAGPFSVDFTYLGLGTPTGVLPYTVFNSNFTVNSTGFTGVPEPSSFSIGALGVLMIGVLLVVRASRSRQGA